MSRFLSAVFVFLCATSSVYAQSVNPYAGDISATRVGATLFGARCSSCHGADAKGIVAPDLTILWANGTDEARAYDVIRNGIPGSIMPPSQAPDNEIWSLVTYLKSINTVPRLDIANGNSARGEQLFVTQCQRCHRAHGTGGSLGPDLSNITRSRTRDELVTALRNPGLAIARAYRTVTLTPHSGSPVTGTLKNEDAFSVQIMDSTQRLLGFRKSELREIHYNDDSLMPAYDQQTLPDADLDHLLYYLSTNTANTQGAR